MDPVGVDLEDGEEPIHLGGDGVDDFGVVRAPVLGARIIKLEYVPYSFRSITMSFQLQYVSDIHLEMHDKHNEGQITPHMFVQPAAPYLALCGDIGIPELKAYERFLEYCSQGWKDVFVIAGNHEFYTYRCRVKQDIATKTSLIESICKKFPNVHFLNCGTFDIAETNLRILGCTLWSDTSMGDRFKILMGMNDARQIYWKGDEPFLPEHMTSIHFQHKAWLQEQVEKAKEQNVRLIVLTHYLPSYDLIAEKYQGHPLNMCFASECEDLFQNPVEAWICGHSHTGIVKNMKGVLCCMNPFGYPGEKVDTRNMRKVLELPVLTNPPKEV